MHGTDITAWCLRSKRGTGTTLCHHIHSLHLNYYLLIPI